MTTFLELPEAILFCFMSCLELPYGCQRGRMYSLEFSSRVGRTLSDFFFAPSAPLIFRYTHET